VLIIVDKKYAEKANDRAGGVGAETQIITPNVYGEVRQEKFIPIVTELDENGKAYMPSYLSAAFYIDMSTAVDYENSYEQLLRNIYGRPSHPRPTRGKAPAYLTENTPMHYKTSTILRGFDSQLDRHPNRINSLLTEFTEEFFENLKSFVISDDIPAELNKVGPAVLSILHQYQQLRNDYAGILDKSLKSGLNIDYGLFFRLLENIPMLLDPTDSRKQTWQPFRYEHFKLIVHELFLHTVAIGLRNNQYEFLEEVFHQCYLIKNRARKSDPETFSGFYMTYNLIDDFYKKKNDTNYYSVHADLMMSNTNGLIDKDSLVRADMISHYVARLNNGLWFPLTYIYGDTYRRDLDFFARLVSKKHFEKIKGILGVDTITELREKIMLTDEKHREKGYSQGFADRIPPLSRFIEPDSIGTGR
jgi:hypothetical protein